MTPKPDPIPQQDSETLSRYLRMHDGCTWEQVGPCVYCADHDVRLYQGRLPEARRTIPDCINGHRWDDGQSESQRGFYFRCLTCGAQEWTQ